MPKTYNSLTVGNAAAGSAILASDHAKAFENINNYRVPPACKVLMTGNKSYTAGTDISWDTDAGTHGFDTDDMWTSGSATRITIGTTGIYAVTASVEFTTSGGTITVVFGPAIALNGAATAHIFSQVVNVNGTAGTQRVVTNGITKLTAGDYLTANFNPSGGTGITIINQPYTYFSATWLGQVS